MNLFTIITNTYDRKARLYPALLLISPVVAVGVAFLSDTFTVPQSVLGTVVGCTTAFLLTQLVRDFGKRKEEDLFLKWGGAPSITIFRYRDSRLDSVTKQRYHKMLSRLVKEAKAPTTDQEKDAPESADAVYISWSNFLRTNTRNAEIFDLLHQENINYGFRRNTWGLRAMGICLSCVAFLCSAILTYLIYRDSSQFDEALLIAGGFTLLILALWIFRFNDEWVKIPANAYAERLVESIEVLSERSSNKR